MPEVDELIAEPETSPFERRYITATELRVKDSDKPGITGYAAVFDKWSEDLGFFKERIEPGAFARSIKTADVRALINHDPNMILGRTRNDTLRLWEDDTGLGFDVDLPDTSYARDLAVSIERRDITQNSFGFRTLKDDWSEDGKRRSLIEVELFDVSPVTFPAYRQTKVKLRLREIGIDYDGLNTALIRTARGLVIDRDVDLIRSTIKTLGEYIPDTTADPLAVADDGAGPEHSADEDPSPVDTLIRARVAEMTIRKNLKREVF